jgi:hypothetical protein
LALLICLTSLRRYVGRDHEDLLIRDLEHVTQVVGRDGHTSDLERDTVRGRLTVDLAVMSHDEMLMKLLEHTALASRVFGVLVTGQGSSRLPLQFPRCGILGPDSIWILFFM